MSESSRDQQVQAILHSYLQAVDAGQTPDRDEVLRQHPEFASELREFFADQEKMDRLASSLNRGHALAGDITLGADEVAASTTEPQRVKYFGDYELQEEVARGGMGVVFKARQVSLNRPVALKMILKGELANEADVQRFRDEAEAAANLDHPNIVPIYEIGEHEGQQYFSMKLIGPGKRRTDLGVKETVRITALVARAVHHAHQRGILHRDLKPSNILFDENGDPHVADFGLAKRVGGEGESGMTRSGAIVGTPSYMAPEQARAEKVLTTAVDVYSLGAILYEWLTGRPPFRGDDVLATLHMVANDEPPRPRSLNPGIDRDLETICLKCLNKDPQRRYGSAEMLAEDLERWQRGEPIAARPVRTPERLMRWCRRKPALAAAGGLAAFALLLALVVFAGAFVMVSESLDSETTERKNAQKLAEDNKLLAEKEGNERKKAQKLAADNELLAEKEKKLAGDYKLLAEEEGKAREQAEASALRIQFEHFFSVAEERPDLALHGVASLLPKAAGLKDQSMANSLRLRVAIWSRRLPKLTAIFEHKETIWIAALSSDGRTALTVSGDDTGNPGKTAKLWDTATGKQIGPLLQHQSTVTAVALSADGKTALTGSFKTARLWEATSGKPIGPPLQHDESVGAVALSADGKKALTGSYNTARLWEAASGKPIGPPLRHQDAVNAVALSADGKIALTGSAATARLWDTVTGKPIGPPLRHHESRVQAVALSTDGKVALTGSSDLTAQLWNTADGKPIGTPLQHQGGDRADAALGIRAVALSTDGTVALTGGGESAQLWEARTGKPIGPRLQHEGTCLAAALSADGTTVLGGSYRAARVWAVASDKLIGRILKHQDQVLSVSLSANGEMALTGSLDRMARLWDTATGKPITPPLPNRGGHLALSANGKTALTGNLDTTARLWHTATGKLVGPVLQHKENIEAVAMSADGKTALTGSWDKTARLWDTATGKPIGLPLNHEGIVWAVALSADGTTALTGSIDRTARLWETATGKTIGMPLRHPDEVKAVAISADGNTILTGCADKTARLWRRATGKPIGPPLLHDWRVVAVALSSDGKIGLTGSEDNTARLWETATGKPIGPPLRHNGFVQAVALSADGKVALTGSYDKTARIWNVPQPLRGDPERIKLWAQVITGLEVDELTAVRVLDAAAWQERRRQLEKLGGPPVP